MYTPPGSTSQPPSRPLSRLGTPPRPASALSLLHHQASPGAYEMDEFMDGPIRTDHVAGQQPSDDVLLAAIREILARQDLMGMSIRAVRMELERRFGVSMDGRRDHIRTAIQAVLGGQV